MVLVGKSFKKISQSECGGLGRSSLLLLACCQVAGVGLSRPLEGAVELGDAPWGLAYFGPELFGINKAPTISSLPTRT